MKGETFLSRNSAIAGRMTRHPPSRATRDISYAPAARTRAGRSVIRLLENATGRLGLIRRARGYEAELSAGRSFWQVMPERFGLRLEVVIGRPVPDSTLCLPPTALMEALRRATYALSPAELPSYDPGYEFEARYRKGRVRDGGWRVRFGAGGADRP
jgi:hypothetical protein